MVVNCGTDDRTAAANACIINEGIQACILLPDHFNSRIDLVLAGNVELHGSDVVDRVQFSEILFLSCTGVDMVAVRGQRLREISADARTGSSNQD